jgi:putative FmdB family regulatory protein
LSRCGLVSIINLQEAGMPTYEYRCQDCRKRAAIVMSYAEYGNKEVRCPHCGSANLRRLVSRVRVARSEESRLDSLADPSDWGDLDEEDPRSMARMMRRMGQELGEEMPPEFDEVIDRLEAGQSPEDIEASMPELGEEDDFGGDGDLDDDF